MMFSVSHARLEFFIFAARISIELVDIALVWPHAHSSSCKNEFLTLKLGVVEIYGDYLVSSLLPAAFAVGILRDLS